MRKAGVTNKPPIVLEGVNPFAVMAEKDHAARVAATLAEITKLGVEVVESEANTKKLLAKKKKAMRRMEKLLKLDSASITAEAGETWRKLSRHAGVQSIKQDGDSIIVTTPLLFTDIREMDEIENEDGDMVEDEVGRARACIGAYEIQLPSCWTKNLVFTSNSRSHWAISDGSAGSRPCLNEWAPEIERLQKEHDWYGLFDTMFHFLRDAVNDGGAYTQSHQWRDARELRRELCHDVTRRAPIVVGGYVVALQTHDENNVRGLVAKVLEQNGLGFAVEFRKKPPRGHSQGGGRDGYCWNMPAKKLMPIDGGVYLAAEVVEIPENTSADIDLHHIDTMPDGATIEDVRELTSKLKKT